MQESSLFIWGETDQSYMHIAQGVSYVGKELREMSWTPRLGQEGKALYALHSLSIHPKSQYVAQGCSIKLNPAGIYSLKSYTPEWVFPSSWMIHMKQVV